MAKKELSAFEQELASAMAKIKEFKVIAEANVCSIFWKNPELMHTRTSLKLEDFSTNMWKVYWSIANTIVIKESKVLDEITVNFFLTKHPKLLEKFNEYGGYEKISEASTYVNESNLDAYIKEIKKWNVVLNMLKQKFPVAHRVSEFVDMGIEDIYDEYSVMLNHIFANAETETPSSSLSEGLYELIDRLDEGVMVGLDYYNMPLLNKETGGRLLGNLDLVSAVSNLGKSTIARNLCIPSAIANREPLCMIINEESVDKIKQEMLVYVSNIIFHQDVQKFVVRDGKFTPETKEILLKSAKWIEENANDGLIRIIPFQRYTVELACKIISKYAHANYKYFIIDTLKLDSNSKGEMAWMELTQATVKLYDLIKPSGLNVHVLFTYQLGKSSIKSKYLSQDSLGTAKSVIDVCSTAILCRALHQDEMAGGRRELKVYRLEGKNGRTKIPVTLSQDKNYQVFFISKNRAGSTSYQIVVENDLSRNKIIEVGIAHCEQDWG